jgi:hypothetical protein
VVLVFKPPIHPPLVGIYILQQARPKHPERWPNRADTDQTAPKNPRLEIIAYSPRYKSIWYAPTLYITLTYVPSSRLRAGQENAQYY